METNSHLSELSTSTQSSGYNSSTASSSSNFIDDQEQPTKVDDNNNPRESEIDKSIDEIASASKLIITITLVKFEDRVDDDEEVKFIFYCGFFLLFFVLSCTIKN